MPFSALIVTLVFVVACSGVAPDKPVFGKRQAGDSISYGGENSPQVYAPSAIENTAVSPIEEADLPITDAQFRLEGAELYTKLCAGCHLPLESSNRRGVDAGKILNDYTRNFPTHKSVDWPDVEGAFMIEAALALPVSMPTP